MKRLILDLVTLTGSFATLICCVLPALLITVGLGATLASVIEAVPGVTIFSENRAIVFSIAGGLLICSWIVSWRQSCSTESCQRVSSTSRTMLLIATVLFIAALLFTLWVSRSVA